MGQAQSQKLLTFQTQRSARLYTRIAPGELASQKPNMASATDLGIPLSTSRLAIASLSGDDEVESHADSLSRFVISNEGRDDLTSTHSDHSTTQSAEYWASIIRQSLNALCNGGTLDAKCLKAPRRRHAGT